MTATQEKKPNWQPTNTPFSIKKVHIYIPEFMHMSLGEGTGTALSYIGQKRYHEYIHQCLSNFAVYSGICLKY